MKRYTVPVDDLRQIVNPLDGSHWQVRPLSVEEVEDAVSAGEFVELSWQEVSAELPKPLHDLFHIRRIAYLVEHPPVESSEHKIILCMVNDEAWLYDGWHRLAAAIVRRDASITIYVNAAEPLIAERLPSAVEASGQSETDD